MTRVMFPKPFMIPDTQNDFGLLLDWIMLQQRELSGFVSRRGTYADLFLYDIN